MKTPIMMIALVAGLATAGLAGPVSAWDAIGQREASYRVSRESIEFPGPQRYQRIKACAFRGPVQVSDLDIEFHNGRRQQVDLNVRLEAGECTRAINLDGRRRNIDTVRLVTRGGSRDDGRDRWGWRGRNDRGDQWDQWDRRDRNDRRDGDEWRDRYSWNDRNDRQVADRRGRGGRSHVVIYAE